MILVLEHSDLKWKLETLDLEQELQFSALVLDDRTLPQAVRKDSAGFLDFLRGVRTDIWCPDGLLLVSFPILLR
jgi:hypothetical protein